MCVCGILQDVITFSCKLRVKQRMNILGSVLSILPGLTHQLLTITFELDTTRSPISYVKKLRYREVKYLSQLESGKLLMTFQKICF